MPGSRAWPFNQCDYIKLCYFVVVWTLFTLQKILQIVVSNASKQVLFCREFCSLKDFDVGETRIDGANCFVCGKENPVGLQLTFRLEDDICRSEFTPADDHCGFDAVTHGGIIFSALDDVMANWIYQKGMRAYTAKCDIRYRGSLPTGTLVLLEGRCVKHRGRLLVMQGTMTRRDTGEVVAQTEASFMVEPGK